jgi:hypothetical protein
MTMAINGASSIRCDAPKETGGARESKSTDGISGGAFASSDFWILTDSFPENTTVVGATGEDTTETVVTTTVDTTRTQIAWKGTYTLTCDSTVTAKAYVDDTEVYSVSEFQEAGINSLGLVTGYDIQGAGEHVVKIKLSAADSSNNQFSYSKVKVGEVTIEADQKNDILELIPGNNIVLSPNATNDSVTIAADLSGVEGEIDDVAGAVSYTEQEIGNLQTAVNGKAPTNHASSATTYGQGNASFFGHVKLSDTYTSNIGAAANGIAASQKALFEVYSLIASSVKTQSGNHCANSTIKVELSADKDGYYLALLSVANIGYSGAFYCDFKISTTNSSSFSNGDVYANEVYCRDTGSSYDDKDHERVIRILHMSAGDKCYYFLRNGSSDPNQPGVKYEAVLARFA